MLKVLLAVFLSMSGCGLVAQQTISSTGDKNTNTNAFVVVNVTVNNPTEKILKLKAKESFGNANAWQGILVPGSDKVRSLACPQPAPEADPASIAKPILTIRAGGNQFECLKFPCNVIRTNSKELLWIDGKKGSLKVEARVLAEDGTVIAGIEHSQFFVNPNRTWRPPVRDDKSSLRVVDEKDNVVLKLRFANRNTLIVEGLFNDGTGNSLRILPGNIHVTTQMYKTQDFQENCLVTIDGPTLVGTPFIFGGVPAD
jgi:hypothetical protein